MNEPVSSTIALERAGPRALRMWLVALLLVLGVGTVYWNSLHVPFVLDDKLAVMDNPTVRSLWPLSGPLSPPRNGLPVAGRPLPNLSFAINRAISGDAVWSYHLGNAGLHALAALALFALLRQTLARPVVPERLRHDALSAAAVVTFLWALHPLQTVAVTYVSQRTELMVSLCYLLTLLAVGRAATVERGGRWWGVFAVVVCAAGMACKEVMVSAPLVALLYDRTFFAGSFREAWRRRWRLHAGLMAGWILLGFLVWSTRGRGGTAGFGLVVSPLAYAATQAEALPRYLGLVFWPRDLVFDYGMYVARDTRVIVAGLALIGALLALTLVALRRWAVAAFAGVLFFAVLAPTSSVVPVATQTMGEHRMYLALAGVLTLVAGVLWRWLDRRVVVAVLVLAVLAAGGRTLARNSDYASAENLWRDTVRQWPSNARAYNNLAAVLFDRGEIQEASALLTEAMRLDPQNVDTLRNLSRLDLQSGRLALAVERAETAQRLDPDSAFGWIVVAVARMGAGRLPEARQAWQAVLRLRPDWPEAHLGLGDVQARLGEAEEAIREYTEALRLRPDWPEAHLGFGGVLERLGRVAEALTHAQRAVQINPRSGPALALTARLLYALERPEEAVATYRTLLEVQPNFPGTYYYCGNALLVVRRPAEALAQFDEAARRDGPSAPLLVARAVALLALGRTEEGAAVVQEALRLDPRYGPAQELWQRLGGTSP
ncbi:MAG: tetratricopeptide repeat protein [Opitutaceae bacterium]|nr:tetratricopeptide repeat protein [Opitutaceae bacterium]